MSPAEISAQLDLVSIKKQSWHIQGCCALTGEGLFEVSLRCFTYYRDLIGWWSKLKRDKVYLVSLNFFTFAKRFLALASVLKC